jgi:predicted GH43/DUF377 family glycosyl hydrolase
MSAPSKAHPPLVGQALGLPRKWWASFARLDRRKRLSHRLVLALAGFLCSCGKYSDFSLPRLSGGDPKLTFAFDEAPEPVMTRGEFSDVLNPSVVHDAAGYSNYYSAFDGKSWHTALATSPDGLHWQRQRILLSPDAKTWEGSYMAGNGSALLFGGRVWQWYEAGPKTGVKIALEQTRQPVLDHGPYMSWDERAAADPYVIRIDPYFYLYYVGHDRADPLRQRIGVARSRDGEHWEKLRTNPVLEVGSPGSFDEAGLGEPAVWQSNGYYWMLYTGRDREEHRRLGLARSTDGVRWEKQAAVFGGAHEWDSTVICDPTVLVENGQIRVWFGGGNAASPDEGLNGQIGYATLRPVNGTLAK